MTTPKTFRTLREVHCKFGPGCSEATVPAGTVIVPAYVKDNKLVYWVNEFDWLGDLELVRDDAVHYGIVITSDNVDGDDTTAAPLRDELVRLRARGSMFPSMLAGLADCEQILFRLANQDGVMEPNDLIDTRNAWTLTKAVMEIIRARALHDADEQGKARAAMLDPSPFSVLLKAARAGLTMLEAVEASDWDNGSAETIPTVDDLRLALAPYTAPEEVA